jgi:Flp pilus assembly protein TadD
MSALDVTQPTGPQHVTVTSENLTDAVSELASRLFRIMGSGVTRSPDRLAQRPQTCSEDALHLYGLALQETASQTRPDPDIVILLKQALTADAEFAMARQLLALMLLKAGRMEEALSEAKRAVATGQDCAEAHLALGLAYEAEGLMHLAKSEFEKCIALNPHGPEPHATLGELYIVLRRWPEASSELQKAAALAPYDSAIRAGLALAYATQGDSPRARNELLSAEGTASADPAPQLQEILGDAYRLVGDAPGAAEHYRCMKLLATAAGVDTNLITRASKRLDEATARLSPKFFTNAPPPPPTSGETARLIERRLGPAARSLVQDPLAFTPAISNWAGELAAGSQDDLQKAERLFYGMAKMNVSRRVGGGKTATEAFAAWSDPNSGITCQEYSVLYVALARSLGLTAHYALVDKDYEGRLVPHACAALSVSRGMLLIDRAYNWFGAPHMEFTVLDDLHAIAAHLAQSGNRGKEDAALALEPDWPAIRPWIASGRAFRGDCAGAKAALPDASAPSSSTWVEVYARGAIKLCEGDITGAALDLRHCAALNPSWDQTRLSLGKALALLGRTKEAGAEFRRLLKQASDPEVITAAHQELARIGEPSYDTP